MIEPINGIGRLWWGWMWPMFWQVGVVVMLVWVVDLAIRRRVWPQVRYALWALVLVKLILPPWLAAPTSVTSQLEPLATEAVKHSFFTDEPTITPPAEQPVGPVTTDVEVLVVKPPVTYDVPMAVRPQMPARDTAAAADSGDASHPAEQKGPRLGWKSWAMLVWVVGVVTLAVWLMLRFRQLRRRYLAKKGRSQLPVRLEQLLAEAAKKLKLRRRPEVVLSREVVSPAVFGVFRPVLLMPAGEVNRLCRRELEHVLLHELAHIKRGDLKVHAFYMVVQIIYWFNPLLWLVRRQLQHLRELCCDATVARILREETTGYRETILQTARRLLSRPVEPGMGLLGLFEDSSRLVTRLKWLEKKTWKHRGLRIATVSIIVAVMTACVLPMAKSSAAAFKVGGGPLDIQLAGVRPDGGADIYDANGKKTGEATFVNISSRWLKDSQYRTFIFEFPKLDDQSLLLPPFALQVRPAGASRHMSQGSRSLVYYYDGKLTYSVGVSLPRSYKKWFTRRIKQVGLTLRYYYGGRGKADFVFKGPFPAGQTAKAEGGADAE
ncbi:MAG: M56 family metallopeptidase, partial [Planctomycetota bacterium]